MHNEKFMLSDLPDYYIGEEGDLKHYKEVSVCLDDMFIIIFSRIFNFLTSLCF